MGSQGLPYGFQAMLKEGHKHLVGLDEAVLKNIEACKQLSSIIKTSMGPNGVWVSNAPPLLSWQSLSTASLLMNKCRHEQDGDQPLGEALRDQ